MSCPSLLAPFPLVRRMSHSSCGVPHRRVFVCSQSTHILSYLTCQPFNLSKSKRSQRPDARFLPPVALDAVFYPFSARPPFYLHIFQNEYRVVYAIRRTASMLACRISCISCFLLHFAYHVHYDTSHSHQAQPNLRYWLPYFPICHCFCTPALRMPARARRNV